MRTRPNVPPEVRTGGFTLIELLVSMAVLALLVALIAQLFSSATSVATRGQKQMDSDTQAQVLFGRLAIDVGRMLKRGDVSYYAKSSDNPQTGNDQIAFYSEVPGYFPSDAPGTSQQSPVSLVGYRFNNSGALLERLGKGLVWTGAASTGTPLVYLPLKIENVWPTVANQSSDVDYEIIGPQIFRFEYSYLLTGRTLPDGTVVPAMASATPWDSRAEVGHTDIEGFRDVAAIIVTIAVIDPKSRLLVSDAQLTTLTARMEDFAPGTHPKPGDLETQWQSAVETSDLPKPVIASLRVYRRSFPLKD